MKETDLYQPVKELFEKMGYTVKGEVSDMDVTAMLGDELVVIELKTSMNLTLILQAINRQKITDKVYVAIPRPSSKRRYKKEFKEKEHLLKRLSLGLILVATDSPVPYANIIFEPGHVNLRKTASSKRKKERAVKEIQTRHGDYNVGGTNQSKIVTAYRENVLKIAGLIEIAGELSVKDIRAAGGGPKTRSILNNNYYGWFLKKENDIYTLTNKAFDDLEKYRNLVNTLICLHITKDNRIICIRKAKISEAKLLTNISFESKSFWDYPKEYFKAWEMELTVTKEYLRENIVYVAEVNGEIAGYFSLVEYKDGVWLGDAFIQKGFRLDHIFVKRDFMNLGVGTRLYYQLKDIAKESGIDRVLTLSDPNATGFYDKIGARFLEQVPSSIPGRLIPLYEIII